MMIALHLTVSAVCLVAAACISYAMALAGEPQSVWLWRDVLGAF